MALMHKTQSFRDEKLSVSIQAILRNVDEHSKFQSDIIDAINNSHLQSQSQSPAAVKVPQDLQVHVKNQDLTDFNRSALHNLKFDEIDARQEKISQAYEATFEWIFDESLTKSKGQSFAQWLQSDQIFYWITGKPGAGKSTLMKYIDTNPKLKRLLDTWAGSKKLRTLRFYFWNSGSTIQMSQEGMLRTLIYEALKQDTQIMPLAFPNRVEASMLFPRSVVWKRPLTWAELLYAFRIYIQEATKDSKIFLLIDGLDEFNGDPVDIASFIETLLTPEVKVCVSSRPWIVFEDAFSQRPSLRVEELSRNDIRYYVERKFRANPGFAARAALDPDDAQQLIENVARKASGVFLWVSLVVRSLLEGLSGGESLSHLQIRLDSLPEDIESLFWKILTSLNVFYFERTSQLFQTIRASGSVLNVLEFSFADEDDIQATFKMPVKPLTMNQAAARADIMRRRLNQCCKGLLEISAAPNGNLASSRVDYLHRTVKDFWEKPENWSKLIKATKPSFNPYSRLCCSRIAMLKLQTAPKMEKFWEFVDDAINYAILADPEASGVQCELLNALDRAAAELSTKPDSAGSTWLRRAWNEHNPTFSMPSDMYWTRTRYYTSTGFSNDIACFLHLAVHYQLIPYLKATQARLSSTAVEGPYSSLLYMAACKYSISGWYEESWSCIEHFRPTKLNFELIQLLFQYGADPDRNFGGRSTWREFVLGDMRRDIALETVMAFLEHGAEPSLAMQKNTVLSSMSRADYLMITKIAKQMIKEKQKEERQKHWNNNHQSSISKILSRNYFRKSWRDQD
jgi:hypothetical protein